MMTHITTNVEFAIWLEHGKTTACVYHTGNLAEAASGASALADAFRDLANATYQAAIDRHVYLLQRKRVEGFEYVAIKAAGQVPLRFAPGFGDGRQG
jgi:hypothetical protein